MENKKIPQYLKPFLWSFDFEKLDLERDKKRIITNVLNFGTKQATDWLFSVYNNKTIVDVLENPLPGEWNSKSLNFWGLIFGVKTKQAKRKFLSAA